MATAHTSRLYPRMNDEELLYTVRDRVATITINRPERMNAWTSSLEAALRERMAGADADDEVRCVVLTGAGTRAFCAGADMDRLTRMASEGTAPPAFPAREGDDLGQRYSYLMGMRKPVIAAMNGAASGVGVCISLYCDIRFMAVGAKLSVPYARRGVVAEYGVAWILARLIGPMHAADLLFSGRTVLAGEAAQMGLVNLLPSDAFAEQVQQRAAEIANWTSPRSVRFMKQQLWLGMGQTLAQACRLADTGMAESIATEDFREGVAHFLEKRAPEFTGR